ncbi:MAG: exonuclease SbcCD subunit D [Pseudanabaenaceae cyanobacterium bins.39]|nr:exonuclease SbcCD subunit D [Pseudanabaenaceae cyanobacterium bins.39]
MRIIHTSDWHLGRKLRGVDRTPEIEAALQEMLTYAQDLAIDAVLVAGDIFDVPNPPSDAERVAYEFFYKLNQLGIPTIAIAGNHDSATRLDSVAQILSLAGVRALGRPRLAEHGGVIHVDTAGGRLSVGAMPFISERRLLSADDLWNRDDQGLRADYKSTVTQILQDLATEFRGNAVNMMIAHMTMDGAKFSGSEAAYYSGNIYSMSGQSMPAECQYVGLGHIHRPQQIPNAAPTYYSGSLIQVDFGEVGEQKGFNIIEVEAGRPAKVRFQPLTCQKPLKLVECHINDLEENLEQHRDYQGYLKFAIAVPSAPIGLADRVRKVCPQAIIVEPRVITPSTKTSIDPERDRFNPVSEFQRFYRDQDKELTPQVLEYFQNLYTECSDTEIGK